MSDQWYFQMMGAEVGPVTPAEMKHRVRQGQIQADTLVRHGPDGKWMLAERVKGLLDAPPAHPAGPPPKPAATAAAKPGSVVLKAAPAPASATAAKAPALASGQPVAAKSTPPASGIVKATTAASGNPVGVKAPASAISKAAAAAAKPTPAAPPAPAATPAPHKPETVPLDTSDPDEDLPHEFDFFRFVGFEQAIGTILHQLLHEHCRVHQLTYTEATRRAIAEFLGRKDLIEKPSGQTAPAAAQPQPAAS